MKHRIKHTEKWFKNKIGKPIKNKGTGIIFTVIDKKYVSALLIWQNEFGCEYLEVRKKIKQVNALTQIR